MSTTRVLKKFEYYKPETLKETLLLLDEYGCGAHLLAGGTNIIVDIKLLRIEPKALVDIGGIKELSGIEFNGKELKIGAGVTISELEKSEIVREKYTALFEAAQAIGTTQIKNSATVAGNICNASPAADTAPPLIVFDAQIEIVNSKGIKKISINDFFTGYKKTILQTGDIVKSIILPCPPPKTGSAFDRITRTASDLSQANASVLITMCNGICRDLRIALGAVNVIPVRAIKSENVLRGKKINENLIKEAANIVTGEISPIDDVRSSAEYRRDVAIILVKRALLKACKQIK